MRGSGIITALIFLGACTSAPRYFIDPPEPVKAKIDVDTQWVTEAGEKHKRQQNQLPVKVADETIYLANAQGEVRAMDLASGKTRWEIDLNERIAAGPGHGKGMLVVANHKGEIIALREGTGEILWRQKVSSEVLAEPLVHEGRVFVQAIDGKVFALAADSGKKLWVDGREIPALTLRGSATPLVVNNRLLVGFASGELVAYNLDSGKVIWNVAVSVPSGRTDLERIADIDGLLAANDDTVYVASYQGRIAAVSVTDGRLVWSREMSSYTGVAADQGQIYVTDAQGFVWGLDINSGATLWRQEKLKNRYLSAPAVMENTVVVADVGGYVFWLSKEDGDILAQRSLYRINHASFFHWNENEILEEQDHGVSTHMSVAANHLLVRNNQGMLALFNIVR